MRKMIVVVSLALVVMVAVPVGVAAWSGVVQVPVVSAVFGMDHARDLGIQPNPAALQAVLTKYGIERPSNAANYTFESRYHWSGSVHIDGVITESALAALPELSSENPYVSGLNFRIHRGYIAVAAFVKGIPGYPFSGPAYGHLAIALKSPTSVSVAISQLGFGNLGVPGNLVEKAEAEISSSLDRWIARTGISIQAVELREGGIYFKGTLPKTISADPPAQP
jgi:hypothetical protein